MSTVDAPWSNAPDAAWRSEAGPTYPPVNTGETCLAYMGRCVAWEYRRRQGTNIWGTSEQHGAALAAAADAARIRWHQATAADHEPDVEYIPHCSTCWQPAQLTEADDGTWEHT